MATVTAVSSPPRDYREQAQSGFELMPLEIKASKYLDYKCMPLHLAYVWLLIIHV